MFHDAESIKLINKILHDKEAFYYDILHGEIWNFYEQLRIRIDVKTILNVVNKPVQRLKVLDIGSGTENLTLKFLYLGCEVTALDISQKMLESLQSKVPDTLRKKLKLFCDDADHFLLHENENYDVITFSSVLHHLPDYLKTINLSISKLNLGGVIYIVHEPLPYKERKQLKLLKFIDGYLNYLNLRRENVGIPLIDHSLTDVHAEIGISLENLLDLLHSNSMEIVMLRRYPSYKCAIINLLGELLQERTLFRLIAKKSDNIQF